MKGVECISWIVVISGILKVIGTVPVFMNVKAKEGTCVTFHAVRQIKNFGFDDYTVIWNRVEFYHAVQLRILSIPGDPGKGLRMVSAQNIKQDMVGSIVKHSKIPFSL